MKKILDNCGICIAISRVSNDTFCAVTAVHTIRVIVRFVLVSGAYCVPYINGEYKIENVYWLRSVSQKTCHFVFDASSTKT